LEEEEPDEGRLYTEVHDVRELAHCAYRDGTSLQEFFKTDNFLAEHGGIHMVYDAPTDTYCFPWEVEVNPKNKTEDSKKKDHENALQRDRRHAKTQGRGSAVATAATTAAPTVGNPKKRKAPAALKGGAGKKTARYSKAQLRVTPKLKKVYRITEED
jgi:hypothetical protein